MTRDNGSSSPNSNSDPLESPTSSSSVTQTVNESHQFVIQGYSVSKGNGVGKHIASENFSVGGYQWSILVYPDGKSAEDSSTYVSVFIVIANVGIEVRGLFELALLDQSGNGKHKVHSHFDRSFEGGPYTLKYPGSMCKGYKRFIRHSLLETSDYLKDDCLKINCTIGVVVSEIHCPRQHSIHVPHSELGSHFGKLLDSLEGSDVTFDIAGEKIQPHKLVLAAQSPFFRSKFYNVPEANNEVAINDLEPKVFKALLHFMYKDSLPGDVEPVTAYSFDFLKQSKIDETLIIKLLAATDKYELSRLRLLCQSHICKGVSISSVAKIFALSDKYNAAELKKISLKFNAENLSAVLQTDAYIDLKDDYPNLKSELLKTVAGYDEATSIEGSKSQSIWGQLSDGGETSSRRVRQRTT